MREVTMKEFFAVVGPLNVHASIQPGPWPYTSQWKTPGGQVIGKSVELNNPQLDEPRATYFLST